MAIIPPEMMALLMQMSRGQGTNLDALGQPANAAASIAGLMKGQPDLGEPIPQTDEAGILEPAIPSLASRLGQDELANPPAPTRSGAANPLMAAIAGGLGALFGGKLGAGSALTSYSKESAQRRQENLQREQIEERKKQQRIAQILQQSEIEMRQEQAKRAARAQAVTEAKTRADMQLTGARIGDLESQAAIRTAEEKRKAGAPVFWETPTGKIGSGPATEIPEGARRVAESYASAKVRATTTVSSREDAQKFAREQAEEQRKFQAQQWALNRQAKMDAAVKASGARLDRSQLAQINKVKTDFEKSPLFKQTESSLSNFSGVSSTLSLLDKGTMPGNVDMETLYAWIKSIDESVVRPSEAEMAVAGRSPLAKIEGFIQRIKGGGTLLPQERETIAKIMKGRVQTLYSMLTTKRKQAIDYLNKTAKMDDAEFYIPDISEMFPAGLMDKMKRVEELGGRIAK